MLLLSGIEISRIAGQARKNKNPDHLAHLKNTVGLRKYYFNFLEIYITIFREFSYGFASVNNAKITTKIDQVLCVFCIETVCNGMKRTYVCIKVLLFYVLGI